MAKCLYVLLPTMILPEAIQAVRLLMERVILIGLAFDGNWEAMSSNIVFEPALQRCICVDIRYVLFIMDKYAGATHLVNEMKIVR